MPPKLKIVKVHNISEGRVILTVCDKGIIGKKFIEDGRQIDLTSEYYKGIEMDDDLILSYLKRTYVITFVGEESIEFGMKNKLIEKENIIEISNTPYAQIMLL